jgi:Uma2 family endonuclease
MNLSLLDRLKEHPELITNDHDQHYTVTEVSWQTDEALLENLSEAKRRGAKPDTSFCIGTDKSKPDIAIEVVLPRGGIDKLAIYKGLGIADVWFWQQGCFSVYHLQADDTYALCERSQILSDLDLECLATYGQHPEPLDAIFAFR